ncbi:MAG: DUF2783 domain-containing protein [Gammaproteobacteria bacterium]|nr:DUF2783 domain-containing protein [Gammaproteobacteria bacterium]
MEPRPSCVPDLGTLKLEEADAFYSDLAALHDGLDAEQSLALNSRLILLLANQVGDKVVLRAILEAAARLA